MTISDPGRRVRRMGPRPRGLWFAVMALLCVPVLAPVAAQGKEVEGVRVEEEARLDGVTEPLVLNGAGVRSKFFVSVYVAGLYLSEKSSSAEAILDSPGPKRVRMHFVYDEISAEKIRAAWSDGYAANHSAEELAALKDRIDQFNGYFPAVKAGDVVDVDYVPGAGTTVRINGDARGPIAGEDFHRATMRIWLGESPASSGLKKALIAGGG
ncbi:MAG: chalcone isomerase family protein [Gammaproteobacteria bacterium]|nr:chalcone isomerase family protein [Gammaproteobacteria bacterium]